MLTKEQLEVINHGGGNILVSASAGSGKTHTMIERVKRLIIKEGVGVNEILAVTFTEAAAADMKEKLRGALVKAVNGDFDRDLYGALTDGQLKNLERQLEELVTADISTMHAFCGRLIRAYFFVAGVSPDFKILDEADANVIRHECIEKTFKEFYDGGEDWFLTLVDRYALGRMDENSKELILSAYAFVNSEAKPTELAEKYETVYGNGGLDVILSTLKRLFDERVESLVGDAIVAMQTFKEEKLEKGLAFTEKLIEDMNAAVGCADVYRLKNFADYKLTLNFERNLSELAKERKDAVKAVRDKFVKLIKKFLKCVDKDYSADAQRFEECRIHTADFVRVLKRFSEIYATEKKDENALDFNDLEHFALKILADPQIRASVKGKYKYVFVDEYQDTNGVQEEIISLLGNNNVFMVGDVKQSIYGFRGCRSEFFTLKDSAMSARGEKVVRLNHNFRSAKNVINAVNGIFNFCMTDGVYGENYREKSQLVAGGIYPDGYEGRAEIHFLHREEKVTKEPEKPRIYDILQEDPLADDGEIQTVADLVAGIIADERKKTFFDTKSGEERQVNYGDVAVLTRSRNGKYVRELVSGLIRNGIPVSSDAAENVCDYPEIKVMVCALKLTDCFLQDLPLVATLKSPIGGFSEEELFAVTRFYDDNATDNHGGFSDAYSFYIKNAKTDLGRRLAEFKKYFDGVRLIADFVGAHGALTKLVEDSHIEAHLYARPSGGTMVDRLRRFVAASIVGGKTLTVKEFLHRVKTCPDAFGLSPFASENTVKVTTIHSSKGLEYPVVIACGLERGFNDEDDYSEIMFSREYGFATLHYDDKTRLKSETPLRGVIRENMRLERMREEMRLFYVATTRATYSLHMTFVAKKDCRSEEFSGADSFLNFIPKWFAVTEYDRTGVAVKRREAQVKKVIVTDPDKTAIEKMKADCAYVYPFEEDSSLPLKASVTALNCNVEEEENFIRVIFDEESPDAESGTTAHKILEHFDFSSGESVYVQAQNLVDVGVIEQEKLERVNLSRLASALSHNVFAKLKDKKLYREKAFLVNLQSRELFGGSSCENVLVQGVIDLLAVDGDEAQIIDYKYSSLTADSLRVKYKKQLDLYAYAVEKILGKKVLAKVLVNVFTGECVEV